MNKTEVLVDLSGFSDGVRLVLWGSGETGRQFAKWVQATRPDITIACFIDSFQEGNWNGIPILKPHKILNLGDDHQLIITSIFWHEIKNMINAKHYGRFKILSNELINQASNLSSYGSFYFERNQVAQCYLSLERILKHFRTDADRQVYRKLFDLRVEKKENEFFEFMEAFTSIQQNGFKTRNKYSEQLVLEGIRHVIEGGVYDGEDTYSMIESLVGTSSFECIFAFDPFPQPFREGKYFSKINPSVCRFYQKVLWDSSGQIGFRVDSDHPANSTALYCAEDGVKGVELHESITVDRFVAEVKANVDLIKLDVEGAEMRVLRGATHSISQGKPKIACSIYHCKEHMFEIPEFLLNINPEYRFSITVNNPTFIDMVLWAS